MAVWTSGRHHFCTWNLTKNKNFRVQKQPSCFHSCEKCKFSFFKSFPNPNRMVGRYIYQPQQQTPSSVISQWFTVLWKTLKLHFLNKWWLKTKDGRLSVFNGFIWGEIEEATRCSSAAYPPIGRQDHLPHNGESARSLKKVLLISNIKTSSLDCCVTCHGSFRWITSACNLKSDSCAPLQHLWIIWHKFTNVSQRRVTVSEILHNHKFKNYLPAHFKFSLQ